MFSSSNIPHSANSMEVINTNIMIPPFVPAPEEDQLILMENVVAMSQKRRNGLADSLPKLPPLPLEKDLFIPPVEKGNRAERSILVLTETFLSMMPQEGREVVNMKETASIMKTNIKRVYTICNVLEGIRLMVRTDRNTYEWQGMRVMMPSMMLLRQMAEKQNMMEKLDMASTEEQGVENVPISLPDKLNICMMTQKLLMMFLVLPQPKVLSLSVASNIMHGAGQATNMKRGSLQKLLDISKILQGAGILRKVKVTVGTDKAVYAYQYVGQEVELVTLLEVEEIGSLEDVEFEGRKTLEEDIGGGNDNVNADEVNELMSRAEERGEGIVELKQSSMEVEEEEEGKKMVRLKFFGDEVERMRDCRRKRKMK